MASNVKIHIISVHRKQSHCSMEELWQVLVNVPTTHPANKT